MRKQEAKWFNKNLFSLAESDDLFPMLNIGSSTENFRTIQQPHIDNLLFKPLRDRNLTVKHLDIKDDPGVDIVGNLNDPQFIEKLSNMRFRSILCSNLLEHVENRNEICESMTQLIPEDGYIFVSVPFKYPYHADPIDTMFRPNIKSLASMFPNTVTVNGEIIDGGTYLRDISANARTFITTLAILILPFYRFDIWRDIVKRLPWLFKKYQVSCIVLKKVVH